MPLPPFPLTRPNEARPITGADSAPPPLPPPSRHSPGPVPPERGRHPPRQQPGTTATAVSSPQPQTGNVVSARRHFRPAVSGSFSNGGGGGGGTRPSGASRDRPLPVAGGVAAGAGPRAGLRAWRAGRLSRHEAAAEAPSARAGLFPPPPRREEPPSSASAAAGGRAAFPGAGFPSRHRRYSSPGVRKAPPEAGGWVGNPSGLL